MHILKRSILLCLAGLLLFATVACGPLAVQPEQVSGAEQWYQEFDITPPDMVGVPQQILADGALDIHVVCRQRGNSLMPGEWYVYHSRDAGESWSSQPLDYLDEYSYGYNGTLEALEEGYLGQVVFLRVLPTGNQVFVTEKIEQGQKHPRYSLLVVQDGGVEELPLPAALNEPKADSFCQPIDLQVSADGRMVLFYQVAVQGLVEGTYDILETIYLELDLEEGRHSLLDQAPAGEQYGLNDMDEATLSMAENLRLRSQVYTVVSVQDAGDNAFLAHLRLGGEVELLFRYESQYKPPQKVESTLRVFSLYEDPNIRIAMLEFELLNPGVAVEYEAPLGHYDPNSHEMDGTRSDIVEQQDIIRNLNLQFLNGTGPDVVILDGLPIEAYVEKGVLMRLEDSLAVGLQPEIVNPLRVDGSLYYLPAAFQLPILLTPRGEEYSSLWELVDAAVAGPLAEENNTLPADERPLLNYNGIDDFYEAWFTLCAPFIFSGDGINTEILEEFLDMMRAVSDHHDLATGIYRFNQKTFSTTTGEALPYTMAMQRFALRNTATIVECFQSFDQLATIDSDNFYLGNPYGTRTTFDVDYEVDIAATTVPGGVYIPITQASIYSKANEPELAQAFIQTLLGYTVQCFVNDKGFPVLKAGFDHRLTQYSSGVDPILVKLYGYQQIGLDSESIIEALQTPAYTEQYPREAIFPYVVAYCRGTLDKDHTIEAIKADLELYFSERL